VARQSIRLALLTSWLALALALPVRQLAAEAWLHGAIVQSDQPRMPERDLLRPALDAEPDPAQGKDVLTQQQHRNSPRYLRSHGATKEAACLPQTCETSMPLACEM